jgi:hypothetical protein
MAINTHLSWKNSGLLAEKKIGLGLDLALQRPIF